MKKSSKSKNPVVPRIDPYLEGLTAKLLERLINLEKKTDIIIAQTAPKSPGAGDQPHAPSMTEAGQPARRERLLYEAICADCHKICEVPFKPSEDRPVYCKTCFSRRKSGASPKPYPVLTPVAMPPKPPSKPIVPAQPAVKAPNVLKKEKKSKSVKKVEKKK